MKSLSKLAFSFLLVSSISAAQQAKLNRDDVASFKKKLVAVLNALGQAPQGYKSETSKENYNLPTETWMSEGSYNLANGSAHREYSANPWTEEDQKQYSTKVQAAQAKGDMNEVVRLSQEMQQKAYQAAAAAQENPPIRVEVLLNSGGGETIDPDAVVMEGPGFIALRSKEGMSEGSERVRIYCDPVSLKDTKSLSKVEMEQGDGEGSASRKITSKTAVKFITIQMEGQIDKIEPWVKKISPKSVLAQID